MNGEEGVREAAKAGAVTVWSIQHASVVEHLRTARFSATYDFVDPRRQTATHWMADQMRDRGFILKPEDAPIWVFVEKPPPRMDPVWGCVPPDTKQRLVSLPVGVSFSECSSRSRFDLLVLERDGTRRARGLGTPAESPALGEVELLVVQHVTVLAETHEVGEPAGLSGRQPPEDDGSPGRRVHSSLPDPCVAGRVSSHPVLWLPRQLPSCPKAGTVP
jgi:hypothetical protein